MNTFNSQRSLTLGQVELYLLFALALAGVINKILAALTPTRGVPLDSYARRRSSSACAGRRPTLHL